MVSGALALPKRLVNTGHMAALAAVERRIPYWPVERVERLQSRRVQSIVRHAYETVPYYRRTMDELGLQPGDFQTVDDLPKLPMIDGTMVRLDPEQFASTKYDATSRSTVYSGGSSSHVRSGIYWDPDSMLRRLARGERDRPVLVKLAGKSWGRRQLYIYPPTGTVPSVFVPFFNSKTWTPKLFVRRHTVSVEAPFEEVVATLNDFQPHIVFSYGSYAEHFFRKLADSGLSAGLPRAWRYAGDMLSPSGRELIEGTYGVKVNSTYAASETGRIGFECEQSAGFHLNIDLTALRIVDDAGQDVPAGEGGEIIVSNLHNRAMVLLNYRIGDWGALATESCPCGRTLPLLERLEGRRSEQVHLADGREISSLVVDMLFKREINETLKAQIVNPAPGHIIWRIVPLAGTDREALRRSLLARGAEEFGSDTRIDVEYVADIPSTPVGKFIRTVTSQNDRT